MANDLNIRIKINSDTKALEVTQDGIEKIRQKSGEASDSVGIFAGSLGKVAALAATGLGFAGLTASVSSFIETSGKFEQYAVSLKVISGSAEKAEKSLAWVKDFTAKTPYTLDQTMEAFIRLKAYGIDATDGSLKTLGDTSAALGKPLMAAVEAMADAMTGENERLKEFGITAKMSGDTIAYNWIDSSGQAKTQIIENNKQIIKSTLEAIFNEKYAGMMDEQAKTWVGAVSNLEDSWTSLKDTIARESGMFDSAKSAISELNTLISNQNGELDTLGRYVQDIAVFAGSATAAITLYYGAQKLAATYTAASVITTTSYNAATNLTTNSVIRLTAAQVALNGATAVWNRLLAVNPLILGGMAIAGGIAYFYDMAQKADQEAKRSYGEILKADKAYADYYSTAEGKASKMGSNYIALENSLQSLQKQRNSATGEQASRLDKAIASTKKQMDAIQSSAKTLYTVSDNVPPPHPPTDKKNKAEERAAEKKRKEAERLAQKEYDQEVKRLDLQQSATLDYYEAIGDASSVYVIKESDKLQKLASAGILSNEQMIDVWLKDNEEFAWKNSELERETDKKILANHIKTIEDKRSALLDYYTQIGDISSAFEISEANKLQKLAESGVYTNEQMLAIWSKDNETYQKEQFEKNNKFWFNLFDGIEKGMDNQIFDAMTNKWTSWGDWFKDFWSSLSTSVARSLSSMLSTSITGSLKEMLLGSVDSGGAQNIFKTYGGFSSALGFSAPAALAGSNTDAAGFTTTTGGTVFDAAGQITKSGSDAESVLSALSNTSSIKTAYGLFTNGIEATVAPYIEQFGLFMQASQFNVGGMSLSGGGALLGGVGGYAIGSLGDKLFGADTKAGSYGAIGGAIGGMFGPVGFAIGAGLGSIIGGMFGSKKSDGVTIFGTATSDYADGTFDSKKKSWFKTKEYHDAFDAKSREQIQSTIGAYDYLLIQMGEIDKTLAISGGKFASIQDFLDRGVAQTFIDTITTADTTEMYNAWSDYAQSINTTIQSALTDSINTYIGDTRNFQTWTLERSGNSLEALKLKSEWATADTDNLQKMLGLDGVTVDNYLTKYKEAINNSFDPETLKKYKTFGEQIMRNTDQVDAYTNALKEQAAVSAKMRPADMMLSRVSDTTSVTGSADGTVTKELLNAFNKLIRSIDQQNTLAQLAAGRV